MYQLLVVLTLTLTGPAMACGPDSDCPLGNRVYRFAAVEGQGSGTLIFFHGVGGSAASTLENGSLREFAERERLTLIAAEAASDDWNIPGSPATHQADTSDELAYFDALLEEVGSEIDIDQTPIFVSGFSAGAMVVWNLACHRPDKVAGFIPVSGTFWDPLPDHCTSQNVNLIHYHGMHDDVVPMQGRQVGDSHQGDLDAAFDLIAQPGSFGTDATEERSGLSCRARKGAFEHRLELCVFEGGHRFQVSFLEDALRQLRTNLAD
ncbi:alpha/beta hydrolase family esterase [Roseobacter sinensis]|uniref:Polyhydroxybutyrate depolymerase n=1 Tax=Roseobacter sinensis TaxID=2931391 RepID=A0ABT3BL24_9RHOB|nr:polyhydroxybutyrate depolymerase [Roseobacter sp. WL0113]MCV3274270.1 polyhydroxybutyrate depolymerase [Roseobacter sp. WL0113]